MKPFIPYSAEERTISLPPGVDFRAPSHRAKLVEAMMLGETEKALKEWQQAAATDLAAYGIAVTRIAPRDMADDA